MAQPDFNVLIIGGGPGGYVAAIRAVQLGMRVALVERESLGGVCLNWGCIPTKALLRSAEVLYLAKHAKDFGLVIALTTLRPVERSRKVSARLVKGVGSLMKGNAVTVFEGVGRLRSATEVEVTAADGAKQVLRADAIILATVPGHG